MADKLDRKPTKLLLRSADVVCMKNAQVRLANFNFKIRPFTLATPSSLRCRRARSRPESHDRGIVQIFNADVRIMRGIDSFDPKLTVSDADPI